MPITVEVTDALGTKQRGTASVTVATALRITTAKLPVGRAGRRFVATIETTGGADPVAFRLAGAKPARRLRLSVKP